MLTRFRPLLTALLALLASVGILAAERPPVRTPTRRPAATRAAGAPTTRRPAAKRTAARRTTAKRAVAKRAVAKRAPTRKRAVRKAGRKRGATTARRARRPIPIRHLANLPVVEERAAMRQGCLDPTMPGSLAAHLGVAGATIEELLTSGDVPLGRTSACVPYVLVSGGEHGTASVSLHPAAPHPLSPVAAAATLTPLERPLPNCGATRRTLELPLRAVLDPDLSTDIPDHVRWQLEVLVPVMVVGLDAGSEAQGDALIRLVLEQDTTSQAEHLQSLEVLEAESRRRVDGVWWLERADGPGMLFGLHGTDYERVLWQSPVHYSRFARGIKPAATVTRTIAVRRGKTSTRRTVVRTVKPKGYHLGVDLVAAKGEEVHAVANARVSFAGRRRGFGNLVVLDHGEGYQTYYAHLSAIREGVTAGAAIARGQIVGLVGSTGHSTGPHLHFEVHRGDAFIDPFDASREPDIWTLNTPEQEWLAQQALLGGHTPVEQVPSRGLSLVFERGNPAVRTDAWSPHPFGCVPVATSSDRVSMRVVGPQP